MKTTYCKPIDYDYVIDLRILVDKYDRLEHFKNYVKNVGSLHICAESYSSTVDLSDFFSTSELLDKLEFLQNKIETQLNSKGYTMQKEPKEIKYNVNELEEYFDE